MTYVVCSAPRGLRQLLRAPKLLVELLTLSPRARVLPVRRKRVRQPILELLSKVLLGAQPSQLLTGTAAPVHTPMLLARPADALDPVQRHLRLQPLQHEVQRLEPHRDGRVDLALGRHGMHALRDAILGPEIGVEVDLYLGDDLEVLRDGDDWGHMSVCGWRAALGWL